MPPLTLVPAVILPRPRLLATILHRLLVAAVILPLLLVAAGCAGDAGSPDEPEDALQQEAARQDSDEEDVEVIDDERSVERRIRDASVAAKIRTALVEADELRAFNFDPVVVNGRVMLRGEVRTQDQRRRAESIAADVDGVRGVINEVAATEEPTADLADSAARDSMLAQMEAEAAARESTAAARETTAAARETTAAASGEEAAAASQEEKAEDSAAYHTVRSGESLWTIARANGVTIAQIRQLNGLGSSSTIKPGQRLRVK